MCETRCLLSPPTHILLISDFKGLKKRITAIRKAKQGPKSGNLPESPQCAIVQPFVEESIRRQSYGSLDNTPRQSPQGPGLILTRPPEAERSIDRRRHSGPPYPSRQLGEAIVSMPAWHGKSILTLVGQLPRRGSRENQSIERRPSISRFFATINRRKSRAL